MFFGLINSGFIEGRKGQIGKTLTWFVSVFIVAIILALFLAYVGLFAGKQILTDGPKKDVSISGSLGSLEVQENLFFVLNSPTRDGETIRDLIIEFYFYENLELESEIREFLVDIFDKEGMCYLFVIDEISFYGPISMAFEGNKNGAEVDLSVGDKKINVELYSKKC